jgi:hypothetical protein
MRLLLLPLVLLSRCSISPTVRTSSADAAVALDVDEWKAAAASTTAQSVPVAATIALGKNGVVDANEEGIPVTVVTGGATLSGTIELKMLWVLD